MSIKTYNSRKSVSKEINIFSKNKTTNKYYGIDYDNTDGDKSLKTIGELEAYPNFNANRSVFYIAGQSGSGKTYFTKKYIRNFLKEYSKAHVFVFTGIENNTDYDEFLKQKRLTYIDHMKLISDKNFNGNKFLQHEELKGSLLVFDDVDTLKRNIRIWLYDNLINPALETSRHFSISIFMISHQLSNYQETRKILMEATHMVIFRNNFNLKMKKFLENYFNIDSKVYKKMSSLKKRWLCIVRGLYTLYYNEDEAHIIDNEE
jgi:GTPase SAR1 family protein